MEENQPSENLTPEAPIVPETPEIAPEISVIEQKKKPWAILAIVLIALLLISTGVVFAVLQIQKKQTNNLPTTIPEVIITSTPEPVVTPTLDLPVDWQTYSIDKAGIEFKFPGDFKKAKEEQDILDFTSDKYILEIFWDSNISDFKQQADGKACSAWPYCLDLERGYTKSMAGGKEVFSAQITSDQGSVTEYSFIIRDDLKTVFLRLSNLSDAAPSLEEIEKLILLRDQMVSSFKFVN